MSKFSKQDYEAIAYVIDECYLRIDIRSYNLGYNDDQRKHIELGVHTVRDMLSKMFQADNPRFRPTDFEEAATKHFYSGE